MPAAMYSSVTMRSLSFAFEVARLGQRRTMRAAGALLSYRAVETDRPHDPAAEASVSSSERRKERARTRTAKRRLMRPSSPPDSPRMMGPNAYRLRVGADSRSSIRAPRAISMAHRRVRILRVVGAACGARTLSGVGSATRHVKRVQSPGCDTGCTAREDDGRRPGPDRRDARARAASPANGRAPRTACRRARRTGAAGESAHVGDATSPRNLSATMTHASRHARCARLRDASSTCLASSDWGSPEPSRAAV